MSVARETSAAPSAVHLGIGRQKRLGREGGRCARTTWSDSISAERDHLPVGTNEGSVALTVQGTCWRSPCVAIGLKSRPGCTSLGGRMCGSTGYRKMLPGDQRNVRRHAALAVNCSPNTRSIRMDWRCLRPRAMVDSTGVESATSTTQPASSGCTPSLARRGILGRRKRSRRVVL